MYNNKRLNEVKKVNKTIINEYIDSLYGSNKSKHTVNNYLSDLRFYNKWLIKNKLFATDVDFKGLNQFKVYLRDYKMKNGRGYSERTMARRVTVVKEFYRYLSNVNAVADNPAMNLEVPSIPKNQAPIYMDKDEVNKLLAVIQGDRHAIRDRAILLVFITTGLRLSELRELDKSDLNNGQLTVRHGKGNRQRKVYLNETCLKALTEYLETRKDSVNAMFISERNNRISVSSINYMLNKYLSRAGLSDKYTIHKLRHTAASFMLKGGVDIRVIQEILGHESLATTQQYTHVQDEALEQAAVTINSIF